MKKTNLLALLPAILLIASCSSGGKGSSSEVTYPLDIVNGSFEEGITGWKIDGLGGFSEEDIVDIANFNDGMPTNKVGDKVYAGGHMSLPSFTGTLTSDTFTLGGLGYVTLKLGAMKNASSCYIEFFSADTNEALSFKLNDEEEKVNKVTNKDFNGTTITSQLIRNTVDLREHLEENIYIKVTDEDYNSEYTDYSFANLDDFRVINEQSELDEVLTERSNQLNEYAETDIDENPAVTTLRNGGFETGDTSYWKRLAGDAFKEDMIIDSSESKYWGNRNYHAKGEYFFNGFNLDENKTGKIRSEKFQVIDKGDGHSYASFMIGGAPNKNMYVAINNGTTGSELLKVYNKGFKDPGLAESLITYYVDLSDYINETLYFTIVDNADRGPFGAIIADDFRINIAQADLVNEIDELKTWANNLDDEAAKADYISAYNGGLSFPLKGEAPVVKEVDGFALNTNSSPLTTNLNRYLSSIEASDDYTASNELVKTITSISKNDVALENYDVTNFTFDTNSVYVIKVSIKDAYGSETITKIKFTVKEAITYNHQITNGGFETGDLTGWEVVNGNVNKAKAISNQSHYWNEGLPFNKEGEYFFNGWDACGNEPEGYTLKSTVFTLGGSGQISFKLGGRTTALVVKTEGGETVKAYQNYLFQDVNFPDVINGCRLATMNTYVADLSEHIGENLYVEIVDIAGPGPWAVSFFDDIKTYYKEKIDIASKFDILTQNGIEFKLPWSEAK